MFTNQLNVWTRQIKLLKIAWLLFINSMNKNLICIIDWLGFKKTKTVERLNNEKQFKHERKKNLSKNLLWMSRSITQSILRISYCHGDAIKKN